MKFCAEDVIYFHGKCRVDTDENTFTVGKRRVSVWHLEQYVEGMARVGEGVFFSCVMSM